MKSPRVISSVFASALLLLMTGGCGLWWIPGEAGDGDVVNNAPPEAQPEDAAIQEMINCLAVHAMLNGWQNCPVLCDGDRSAGEIWLGAAAVTGWRPPSETELSAGPVMRLSGGVSDGLLSMNLSRNGVLLWEHSIRLLQ